MRKVAFSLLFIAYTTVMFSQNQPPLALNDTLHVYMFDDTLTINVLQNDYDPDGDSIFVFASPGAISHTFNAITYRFPYETYHKKDGVVVHKPYMIMDAAGNGANGMVYVHFHNPYYEILDINAVSARISNKGNHFWDGDNKLHYLVPKEDSVSALFNFAFWIGGLDINQQLHFAGDQYGVRQNFWAGPVSDTTVYNREFDTTWNKVWKIRKTQIDYHRNNWWTAGYQAPDVILTWPGNGDPALGQSLRLAPFHDHNNNDIYEPLQGEYPLVKGDQAVFFIMNDNRRAHTGTNDLALGVEIHAMAYAFDCQQDSALWYSTFLHYDVFNRSANTYTGTYIAAFTDVTLGYAWDDYVGCDVARGGFYGFNGLNNDGSGEAGTYGAFPPAIAINMLAGPFLDNDSLDNPAMDTLGQPLCGHNINGAGFGDGIADNERYGMSFFLNASNCPGGPGGPGTAPDLYNIIRGHWKDGVHLTYGGNGHPICGGTGPDCRFMFPGLSDPCNWGTDGIQPPGYVTGSGGSGIPWTMSDVGNCPDEYRGTITMGPFTFSPGDKQQMDVAFIWARQYTDTNATAVLPLLMSRTDQIKSYFLNDTTPCGGSFSGIGSIPATPAGLIVYPNPAVGLLVLEYQVKSNTAVCCILSLTGAIQCRTIMEHKNTHQLDISELESGMYFLIVRDGSEMRTARFIRR
ncbi:MAG TPA: T9SS type A sorting domain-containing protein [Bacteroidales bacterium]|nr:T9SS type A sorting domain-containing protein [Bacteroidales bacterium]HSA43864.1 T9SS type A sorting domain-containing protein [Bacteroidales bacterium]